MRDIRRSISYAKRDRRNLFVESGMEFGEAVHVVEEIGERFGRWQDLECRSLKHILVDFDRNATGALFCLFSTGPHWMAWCPNLSSSMSVLGFCAKVGALDDSN